MEAIVLAGGFGARLAARLSGVPKPMAPVAGRPFLEILLNQLGRAGFGRVILSVGYLHATIQAHFGPSFHGMTLDYAIETAPLGTGGAIRRTLAKLGEDAALILNGDTFLDADYAQMLRFHAAQGTALTIAVTHQPDIARYGGVVLSGNRVAGFQEKGRTGPGWINAGAYVVARGLDWPPHLPEKFSFEKDFLAPEAARLSPAAYRVEGFFLDIGIPEDLDRAQTELDGR